MAIAHIIFGGSLLLLAWVYLFYPLLALAFGRVFPRRLKLSGDPPKLVTVGIAVHNGADQIASRLANVLAESAPSPIEVVVASDGSTDRTSEVVAALALNDPRIRLLELPRMGQSAAQSKIFEQAHGQVVVLTDIETRFAPGCLEALLLAFADDRVGCTTGVLRWHYDQVTQTARHEGLYWRYEQTVRSWESSAGWLSAGTGALLASRTDLYRPVPAHASLDQMLPLIAREAGLLVVIASAAAGSDRGSAGPREQFWNRARICTQGIEANLRMMLRIPPWRRPGSFLAIWSHKLLRWATPFLGAAAVMSGILIAAAGGGLLYLVPTGAALLILALAAAAYLAGKAGRSLPVAGFALTLVTVNVAFGLGWMNVVLRRPVRAWDSKAGPSAQSDLGRSPVPPPAEDERSATDQ